jgi:hypothetical protein
LKYLHKTKELGLVLFVNDLHGPSINNHTDASFGVHRDGRSQSGSASSLGRGSFYSSSHKQKLTTKSSTEAELVAATNAGNILGTRNYLISRGLRLQINSAIPGEIDRELMENNVKMSE